MSALLGHLRDLFAFLEHRGMRPPTQNALLVEIVDGTLTDDAGRLRVKRRNFVSPELFAARFDVLTGGERRWVNLSCVGIDGDFLIISVEPGASVTTGTTSVNYSGPTAAALHSGWRASESLAIE